jgi:hypothetical protein
VAKRSAKVLQREELFVAAYLSHGNATQAAKDAGFSAKMAYAKGHDMLKRPSVRTAIDASRTRIVKKLNVTAERIVEEMAVVAFSDIRHYSVDGQVIDWLTLAPGAPDSAMRAIKRVKRKERIIPQKPSPTNPNGEPVREVETEFELWSKDSQVRSLGDYRKLFKENRADSDDDGEELTAAQREERIINLLRQAQKRKQQQERARGGSRKKAG